MGAVTKAEYARMRGVSAQAVSAWIARRHLATPALLDDGRIDVGLADKQLRERLDHRLHATPIPSNTERGDEALSSPVSQIERQRQQRIEEGDIKLRRLRLEERQRAGQLVDIDEIGRALGRVLDEQFGEIENWVLDLAERLGGVEGAATARREWRTLRERQANAAAAGAAALPDLVEHPE